MSSCPQHVIHMGGVPVYCLVDTGSMFTTITESCFAAWFKPWETYLMKKGQWPFYILLGLYGVGFQTVWMRASEVGSTAAEGSP